MKKLLSLFLLSALFLSLSVSSSAQKNDLNGKWKLDRTKSPRQGEWPLLIGLSVSIKGDSLYADRLYELTDGQQYPFSEALTLDNKEVNIYVYDMPRKIKATWSAPESVLKFESTTTFYSNSGQENFISTETWKADAANKTLTINYISKTSAGEVPGIMVFIKE